MIEIRLITTLDQFASVVPLFKEGYHEMNRKEQVFSVSEDGFLNTLLGILNTTQPNKVPSNGIAVAFDGDEPVGFGAGMEDTPPYCEERHFLLWALYAKRGKSSTVASMLFRTAEAFAKVHGYRRLIAYNARFSGASYRFFEGKCGMRRAKIQFTKEIK